VVCYIWDWTICYFVFTPRKTRNLGKLRIYWLWSVKLQKNVTSPIEEQHFVRVLEICRDCKLLTSLIRFDHVAKTRPAGWQSWLFVTANVLSFGLRGFVIYFCVAGRIRTRLQGKLPVLRKEAGWMWFALHAIVRLQLMCCATFSFKGSVDE